MAKKKGKLKWILGGGLAMFLLSLLSKEEYAEGSSCALAKVLRWNSIARDYWGTHGSYYCLAMIHYLSKGDPNYSKSLGYFTKYGLTGEKKRYGLMSVDYDWAVALGFDGYPNDLFDPRTNINWGTKIINHLVNESKGLLVRHYQKRGTPITSSLTDWPISNAFVWYVKGPTFARPLFDEDETKYIFDSGITDEFRRLYLCYWDVLGV